VADYRGGGGLRCLAREGGERWARRSQGEGACVLLVDSSSPAEPTASGRLVGLAAPTFRVLLDSRHTLVETWDDAFQSRNFRS